MKKILVFAVVAALSVFLAACDFNFTTTSTVTSTFMTSTTTSATEALTSSSVTTLVDVDTIKSEIYARIYNEMYEEIRSEVIQNISEERFDQIYQAVVMDILEKIDSGEITVTAKTIIDMIYDIVADESKTVIGVSSYAVNGTTLLSIGSGIIYKHLLNVYYVVTNNHVVDEGSVFKIRMEDGTEITAFLKGVDSLVDVAVLYFTSTETYPVAKFADSETVSKGSIVLAVGNPSGYEYYRSITIGIVSGINRYFDIDNDGTKDMFVGYVQHDASINAGNSGGALFNLNGEVIGINVIKIAATEIEGMGFAIPSSLVRAICRDIEIYGVSKQKPVLGITFVDLSSSNREYLIASGVVIPDSITSGFYVESVLAGASLDGYVLHGDIITQIGDIPIVSTADFVYNFSKYRVGDIISISVYRSGQILIYTDIELKPKP